MIEKTNCQHCAQSIEFELSDWTPDARVECPHCAATTELQLKASKRPRTPLPPPLPEAAMKVEEILDILARIYLWLSLGGAILYLALVFPSLAAGDTERVITVILLALAAGFQGYIGCTVLRGLGEIIRLLRPRRN